MRSKRSGEFAEEEEEFRRALDAVPPPTPPDGGWGWIIVLSSFFTNVIVDGVCYSYGVMLPELTEALHASTAIVSLGGALLLGTYMMSGPVASALCNKFGSRKVALTGCLISTMSVLLCPTATNGSAFVVLFGLCTGIGFGMMFLASLVVVGFYFERNRGAAATVAMCGSSVGMALLAPLIRWLLDQFHWNGTLLILSGVVLQGAVLAMLLKPLDADLQRRKKLTLKRMEEDKRLGVQTCVILQRLIEQKKQDRTMSSGSLNNGIITSDNQVIRERDFHKHRIFSSVKAAFSRSSLNTETQSRAATPLIATKHPHPPTLIVTDNSSPCSSVAHSPMLHRSDCSSPHDLRKQVLVSQSSNQLRKNTSVKSLMLLESQTTALADPGKEFSSVQEISQTSDMMGDLDGERRKPGSASTEYLLRKFLSATPNVDRPMYRKDIYYTGSVQMLPQYHNDVDEYRASMTDIPQSTEAMELGRWSRLIKWLPKSIKDVLRSVFDTSTFASPTYILLTVSTSLTMLGYYVPFILLPSFAVSLEGEKPITKMAATFLLSILGGSNTFGRIISGVLGTRKWVDSIIINNLSLLIAGVVTMLLPFWKYYTFLVIFTIVFGLCVAAFSSLRSVIVVELMGLDKLTTCYSQLVIFHGMAVLVGASLAGYLLERYDGYEAPFCFAGGAMLASGLISMPLRKLAQWEKMRQNESYRSEGSSEDDIKKGMSFKPRELVGL
ncbi:monocarboxylate transporter 5-like [Watersipora subatra]|uniref:monocarboxylate transporter 5-like n=1 Tax=Watersipora subatra TaxID=2589382 RepID=UPI00355C2495